MHSLSKLEGVMPCMMPKGADDCILTNKWEGLLMPSRNLT